MNRQQRRRQAKQDKWADGISAVHREAAGMLQMLVVRPDDVMTVIGAAVDGDQYATTMARAVAHSFNEIRSAPADWPALCASCSKPIRDTSFSLCIVHPMRDAPTNCVGLAVCFDCATDRDEIRHKAAGALRDIWPDAREVTVTHPSARA